MLRLDPLQALALTPLPLTKRFLWGPSLKGEEHFNMT